MKKKKDEFNFDAIDFKNPTAETISFLILHPKYDSKLPESLLKQVQSNRKNKVKANGFTHEELAVIQHEQREALKVEADIPENKPIEERRDQPSLKNNPERKSDGK